MTTLRKAPSKPANTPKFQWKAGQTYVCTMSKSPGYRVGEIYTAYENDKGWTCLMGRDGYEDICTMLISSFRTA